MNTQIWKIFHTPCIKVTQEKGIVTEHSIRATNNTVLVWVINKLKPYKISLASSKSYICKLDEDAPGQREARDSHLFCFVSHSVHAVRETSPSQTQQSTRRAQEKMNDP